MLKYLYLLLLVHCTVSAPPRGSGEEEDDGKGIIVQCLVENWGQEDKIQACRTCFENIGEDVLSEANLPAVKKCVSKYLPMENAACQTEIAALKAGDEAQGGKVLECMWGAIHENGLNYCLSTTSNDASVADRLTDATMCLGKGHKYIKQYVRNATMTDKQRKRMAKKLEKKNKLGPMKFQMIKLLTKAHCDVATAGDTTKDKACNQCFMTGLRTFRKDKDEAAVKETSVECAKAHLKDKYSECTALMESDTEEEAVHGCFMRVLTKTNVEECTNDASTADAETLEGVMECIKKRAAAWVEENARGKIKEKFLEMIGGMDDEDSQEDLE